MNWQSVRLLTYVVERYNVTANRIHLPCWLGRACELNVCVVLKLYGFSFWCCAVLCCLPLFHSFLIQSNLFVALVRSTWFVHSSHFVDFHYYCDYNNNYYYCDCWWLWWWWEIIMMMKCVTNFVWSFPSVNIQL